MNCPKCHVTLVSNHRFCHECGTSLGVHAGYSLQGRFRVERLLGQGGFGLAYLGLDEQLLGKPVVIKELASSNPADSDFALLCREADTLIHLKHPAIPTCFAFFEELGHHYLVLEYLRGETILDAIAKRGKFAEPVVCEVLAALLDVVAYLHHQSPPLIHSDLSPENIILLASGGIGLIDFGATRSPGLACANPELAVGKEIYTAPEQLRGEIHPASDLYSLGVTTLYMVSGSHPRTLFDSYAGSFHWEESRVSPLLNTVVRRLLERKIEDRFASADVALDVLRKARSSGDQASQRGTLEPFSQACAMYHRPSGTAPKGKLAWRYKTGPIVSSVALRSRMLFSGSLDHQLTVLEVDTGRFMWKFAARGSLVAAPAATPSLVLAGDDTGAVYALEPFTGLRRWTFRAAAGIGASPVVVDEVIYFGTNDGYCYAIETSGRERWRCIASLNDRIGANLAVVGSAVLAGTQNGNLLALDRFSGIPHWEFHARGGITASPVVAGTMVYVGCRGGWFYGLDVASGQLIWEYEVGDAVDSSGVVFGSRVYFGSRDGNLYCLGADDGRLQWKFSIATAGSPAPLAALALVDGVLYFGTWNGRFYALDAEDGTCRWWFQTTAPIRSSAVVAYDLVLVTCEDGYIYAIH